MTEEHVADLDVLDQVDRHVLARALLLDRRAVGQRDDPGLDGDVAAGDAGVIEQAGCSKKTCTSSQSTW